MECNEESMMQAGAYEEILENTDTSQSDNPKQNINEEIPENTDKHSFSSYPKQLDNKEEILERVDKSISSGSPKQAGNTEEIFKNLVIDSHCSSKQAEPDETSLIRSAQERSYVKPLSQENASSTDEFEILNTEKRLDMTSARASTLHKRSVDSGEYKIPVAGELEKVKEKNTNNCIENVGCLLRTEEEASKGKDMKCVQDVDAGERSQKAVQHATPTKTYGVQNLPGPYSFVVKKNRQTIGTNNFNDILENAFGKVKKRAVQSVSKKQALDTTASDNDGKEITKGDVTKPTENKECVGTSCLDDDHSDSLHVGHTEQPILECTEDDSNNKQEHDFCDDEGAILDTYEEKNGKIYKLENSENVLKEKKKYRKKPCTIERGTQTAIQLLDSSEFRDYSLDFATVQVEVGFMSVDDLQGLDPSLDDWPILLVSQLRLRDTIISTLKIKLLDILSKGRRLEEDVDYLKLKIWDLKQQVKEKSPNKKEQCSQTTEEDFASAWRKWYCEMWYQYYYGDYDPYSDYYWPGYYSQYTAFSSFSQMEPTQPNEDSSIGIVDTVLMEDEMQGNVEQTVEKEENKGQVSEGTQVYPQYTAESNAQEHSYDSNVDVNVLSQQRMKRKKNSNDYELSKSQKDTELYDEGLTKIMKDYGEYETDTSNIDISNKITESKEITQSHEVERLNENYMYRHDLGNSGQENQNTSDNEFVDAYSRWDASGGSIAAQVEAAASEAVQNTGYVFQEELGLYYDYYSGYYYDAENGLYYDSNTGTYFFYDHASQAYQFHSQVSVKKEKKRRLGNDEDEKGTQQEKKKRLPEVKTAHEVDREKRECSDSNEGEQDRDEMVVDKEEADTSSELDEEAGISEEYNESEETSGHIPPSLRLMVVESESDKIKVGSLHLVTLDGGTVGREADSVVQLADVGISKVHAEITYHSDGPEDHHYFIKDLGSNNGTFVNGVRLSEPREASQKVEIGHGWMLQFGSVTFKCHMHPGRLTCNECEPGLVVSGHTTEGSVASYKDAKSLEKARKQQLKALQKKYAVTSRDEIPVSGEYSDRALKRLKEVGSDNPYEKTEVASADTALRENNKGYTLLQKMGWSEGQGLGKSEAGITEPIQPESAVGYGGFGSTHISLPPEPPEDTRRKQQLQITQERYKQASDNH